MQKYVRVMDGTKSNAGGFEYKPKRMLMNLSKNSKIIINRIYFTHDGSPYILSAFRMPRRIGYCFLYFDLFYHHGL